MTQRVKTSFFAYFILIFPIKTCAPAFLFFMLESMRTGGGG